MGWKRLGEGVNLKQESEIFMFPFLLGHWRSIKVDGREMSFGDKALKNCWKLPPGLMINRDNPDTRERQGSK